MARTRSQARQAVAMKQFVHRVERVRDPKLLLENPHAVLAPEPTDAAIAISGTGFEPLHEPFLQLTRELGL
jgi:hypothetical protein